MTNANDRHDGGDGAACSYHPDCGPDRCERCEAQGYTFDMRKRREPKPRATPQPALGATPTIIETIEAEGPLLGELAKLDASHDPQPTPSAARLDAPGHPRCGCGMLSQTEIGLCMSCAVRAANAMPDQPTPSAAPGSDESYDALEAEALASPVVRAAYRANLTERVRRETVEACLRGCAEDVDGVPSWELTRDLAYQRGYIEGRMAALSTTRPDGQRNEEE